MADLRMIGRFAATWAELFELSKPTVAAVQGWCIAGGTDLVLNADLIVAGESATFGYPPASLPLNQLQMLKLVCNSVAQAAYQPEASRTLSSLFDGVARHTQEGLDFVARAGEVGWRQVVRERDEPFGDYGARPRTDETSTDETSTDETSTDD